MTQLIQRGVLQHLLQAEDLNLNTVDVFPALLHEVGDAIAEMMLGHGYRLVDQFVDGRDVVVSFYCAHSGHQLRPIALTLAGMPGQGRDGLAVLLREIDHSQRFSRAGGPIRFAGIWYRRLDESATSQDLIDFAMERFDSEADLAPVSWREVA
ncbi:hypothetical protein [Stutzerimonas stutzeri]|uniref:Uncharacterized protein n=1 Tax=Stutzerimonas stutzeri TaxID=316 RepID=A0AA40V7D1_STUST|nr:hypothetical protein [Stutzerimonas stutzeri]MBA1306638.1 hypothetical protein [Stutzerimonas stutzeri]